MTSMRMMRMRMNIIMKMRKKKKDPHDLLEEKSTLGNWLYVAFLLTYFSALIFDDLPLFSSSLNITCSST